MRPADSRRLWRLVTVPACLAGESVRRQKARAALSVLGVTIGAAGLVVGVSISSAARTDAVKSMERLGLHNVVARTRPSSTGQTVGLTLRDVAAITRLVPTVRRAAPVVTSVEALGVNSMMLFGRVVRATPEYQRIAALRIARGRRLLRIDMSGGLSSCVVGGTVASTASATLDVGTSRVRVAGDWCRVVGVLNGTDGASGSETLAADVVMLLPVLSEDGPVDEIWLEVDAGADVIRASALIQHTLLTVHGGRSDFELVVPQALLNERLRAQRRFDVIVATAAVLLLIVGGIGILNVMLASVVARIPEIGLRRVAGATRRDILVQFVFEGAAIALMGAFLGVASGTAAVFALTSRLGWRADVGLPAVMAAVLASLSVGLLSSAYPATCAAAVQPIEAVRYE